MIDVPAEVMENTSRLLALIDTRLPDRLEAFYLTGSVAQGDYRDGQSDIDFVAVMRSSPDLAILSAIHAELAHMRRGPDVDGIYLLPGELTAPPSGSGVAARGGIVAASSRDERHPAAWLLLADHGIALRGRVPDASWIAADRDATIRYSRENLLSYWRDWVDSRRHLPPSHLPDEAISWGVLGIARLDATIRTGRIPSKTKAGHHAFATFPAHARIVTEALRLRTGGGNVSNDLTQRERHSDLIAFMDAVIGSPR